MTNKEYEQELNKSWELGIIIGYERASEYLMERSLSYFRTDDDKSANQWRNECYAFKNKAKELRQIYDKKYEME